MIILKITGRGFAIPDMGRSDKLGPGAWITVVGNSYGVPATVSFGYFGELMDAGWLDVAVNIAEQFI